jgi:hypothetical protein
MNRLTKNKKYYVEWIDFVSEPAWRTLEQLKNTDPAITEGIYTYLGKGKAGYIFAGEKNGDEYGNTTFIPSLNTIKKLKAVK